MARSAGECPGEDLPITRPAATQQPVRVGLAYDAAFCFYYQDNLELLESVGAEIVRFSPLHDDELPVADLLYFGGGYPELYGETLAANMSMRSAVQTFARRGGAVYAECGGLMYLTEAIRDGAGARHEMVGVFPAEAVMRKNGMTLGYRTVEIAESCMLGGAGTVVRGHEFHYSMLEPTGELHHACTLSDAAGKPVGQDGLTMGNTLALYSHLHFGSHPAVVADLLGTARRLRGAQASATKG